MATITTRAGKGSPLTNTEVDDNFSNLNSAKYESGSVPTFGDVTISEASPHLRLEETGSGGSKRLDLSVGSDAVATIAANQSAQTMVFEVSSNEALRFNYNSDGVVFNEGSLDRDFRVESNDNTNALFVDGGNSYVGVNRVPSVELDVMRVSNAYPFRISSPAGSGRAMVFADSATSPSRANWLMGAQYNTDNGWELTPSTASGGYTFTNRVLTAYATGDLVVNENGINADFRVESSDDAYALLVDGALSRVGIRKSAPGHTLDVGGGFRAKYQAPGYTSITGTSNSSNWWKIGRVTSFAGSRSLKIRIMGTYSYSAGLSIAGETTILFRASNSSTTTEGTFWSETGGLAHISSVAWKQTGTGDEFDIWVKWHSTFAGVDVYVETEAQWVYAVADTNSTATPSGATLLSSRKHTYLGNNSVLAQSQSGTVFNEDSHDHDFRIESNGNNSMFFVNANVDQVNIGTSSLIGAMFNLAGDMRLMNSSNKVLKAMKPSGWGYSQGAYGVTVLGGDNDTGGTVSIGFDPSVNADGSFSGYGQEMIFNKDITFYQSNNDNSGWTRPLRMVHNLGVILNETSLPDLDFRVESDNSTHMLFVDSSTNKIGVNWATPGSTLDVYGPISSRVPTYGTGKKTGILMDITSSGTPSQVKIATNIPYTGVTHAHTVTIRGFTYSNATVADIQISWHVYLNQFYNLTATSSGSWAPVITLAVESNKVVIHLSGPGYWPKLYVDSLYDVYGNTEHATGWTWSDNGISADSNTPVTVAPYKTNTGNGNTQSSSAAIFNENSENTDFRVESNNNTHAIFVDASDDFFAVGNNTNNPASGYADQHGFAVNALQGWTQISADATPLTLGRTNTAGRGSHIIFRQGSNQFAELGDYNGVPYLGYTHVSSGGGIMFNGRSIEPTSGGSTRQTNTNDLGSTNFYWRDGHFSRTVSAKTFRHHWTAIDMSALDFNTFYPVSLEGGNASVINTFELAKYYGNNNPVISGTTMLGSAWLKMKSVGYSWGGNPVFNQVEFAQSTYRGMVGAVTLRGYYVPVIWLRGDYKYHWRSDHHEMNPTVITSNTTYYSGTAYSYIVGPITATAMAAKPGYLGESLHTNTLMNQSCNDWYT